MPRTSVKGQVLVDLVVEFTKFPYKKEEKTQHIDGKLVSTITQQETLVWKLYIDDAENQKGSGVGLVLVLSKRITIKRSLKLGFSAINSKVEYEVLLMGMTMVQRTSRGNRDVLGLKSGCWLSEGRVRSERRENARVPGSS